MNKRKRILSLLLILTMLLSLQPRAQAVQGQGVTLRMSASSSAVRVEETVALSILTDSGFASRGSGITVFYDDTVLEPVPDASCGASPFAVNGPVNVNGRKALRVSFLPGMDAAEFRSGEALAVITFKALAVADTTRITMEGAYLYDDTLSEIPVTMASAVELTVEPPEIYVPVTGISLNPTELTLQEGERANLTAAVVPAGASDPTIFWSSSNPGIAQVDDGAVTARREGTAVITATTRDGSFSASCSVTVTAPDAGYTVAMPGDQTAVMGGVVSIPVTVSNEDGETGFNAFDIRFAYDPTILEFAAVREGDVRVSASEGVVSVLGYGADRAAGSVPFTLEFVPLRMENTQVRILEARVDNSGNAITKNTSLAALTVDASDVVVTGYPVTLPEGFEGEDTAVPNTDYTFCEPDDHFDYAVRATVSAAEVAVTDNGDGSYTIPGAFVTGEIVVTAAKTGKIYQVTLGTDMTGALTAQHGVDYTATLNRDESFRYTVTVTIGEEEYTGYAISGDTVTIPGGDIIADIIFTVLKEPITPPTEPVTMHKVTFSGSGAGAAQGNPTSVAHGSNYRLTLKKQAGYTYRVSYRMGGRGAVPVSPNRNGTYTIVNVTAPLEIIIERTLDIQISVNEYVTLDKQSAYLILARAALDYGRVFAYEDNVMYYSEAYGAWAYIVISDSDLDLETVRSRVAITYQNRRTLENTGCDVDKNGWVDRSDARLVLELYNARYCGFDTVSMIKFLSADVNADRKLDVRDAAAVVRTILELEEEGT